MGKSRKKYKIGDVVDLNTRNFDINPGIKTGKITSLNSNGTYDVEFEDRSVYIWVPEKDIIKIHKKEKKSMPKISQPKKPY